MSENLVETNPTNKHENDFFHKIEVSSARIKDSESKSNEFSLIIDKKDAEAIRLFYKDEAGNEGYHSVAEYKRLLGQGENENEGIINYKQANGDQGGFIFKLNSDSFDFKDNGDLEIIGKRKSAETSDASKKLFDENDIFGEENLSLHKEHHKEDFKESEKIQEILITTDTLTQGDWKDLAKDYHYDLTKAVVDTIFTSKEFKDEIKEITNHSEISRNSLVAKGDINLDEGAKIFHKKIGNWFSGAAKTVASGFTSAASTVVGGVNKGIDFVKDYVVKPISSPQTWQQIGGFANTAINYSDNYFRNTLYPAFNQGLNWARPLANFFSNQGNVAVTGNISDLFSQSWSAGGSNVSLSLGANLDTTASYSLPKSVHGLFGGRDVGSVDLKIAVPITATFKGSFGANNPLLVPLVNKEIAGPSKTLTAPQSGYTAGGQVASKVKYGLDAYATANGNAGFEVRGGITPVISLSASKSGVIPSARLDDRYFNKSSSSNFDRITGLGLKASVTPELEISAGLYVPTFIPVFGGDKLATIGSTLSVPISMDVNTNSANFGASVNYSVDTKFLETTSNRGWHSPIGYQLTSGTIAGWDTSTSLA